jgi:predicted GTPase
MSGTAKRKLQIPKGVLNRAKREEEEFEHATVQGGIIGITGTGKSSLINALAGRDIAEVGVRETTGVVSKISSYEFNGIVLIDLPGAGTRNWRTETYFSKLSKRPRVAGKYSLRPEDFDFFILVLANRILDEDLKLYRLITKKLKKRCFMVRSKFDTDASNNWRTKRKSDKETHREIRADVWRNFPREKRDRVFVISSADPARGDFDELEAAIMKALPEVKAEKFLAFAMAYSEQTLKKKRIVAEKHAGRIALLSAGNAFNPIPGFGTAVDLGLLLKLSHDLVAVYGLTSAQLEHEFRLREKSAAWGLRLKRNVLGTIRSLLTSRGILSILRELGHGLETKELTKWLPYVGQTIAAFLGYRLTSSYAQEAITRCEIQALSVLKEVMARE